MPSVNFGGWCIIQEKFNILNCRLPISMKKIIILLAVFTFYIGHSQFNSDAPWMMELQSKRKTIGNNDPVKFEEIVDAFNNYWKNRDHTKKGSGYKPFKRWENHWRHFVKEDGTLPTPQELMEVFKQKQVLKNTLPDISSWQSMGPYAHTNTGSWSSGQGRVNTFIIDPNNVNIYYTGTPAGGIWQSKDSGTTWKPLSDDLLQIGVSAIAIDPRDSDIIYIGTGDDDAGDTYSIGVLKSTDGGNTWNTTGLTFNDTESRINEIYLDPSDYDRVFISSNKGFYKSIDAGVNFTRTLNQDLDDAKLKPGDSNIIYAATGSHVYRSIDNGDSFHLTDSGLPVSTGRIALAVTTSAPNNVYVLVAGFSFKGIYKSTDSGTNYSRLDSGVLDLFDGTSQGWYDLGFEVADTDENIIYVGTVDIFRSINGGISFTKWNSWNDPESATYTHADIHKIIEINGDMYFATDGGIYKLAKGSTSTIDLTEGLAIGQFYRIAVSPQTSSKMVGGLQDNGGYAYSNSSWKNYYGADGMDTAIDPNNSDVHYGFIQNGSRLYISRDGGNSQKEFVDGPTGGNWITPLVINKEGEIYAGYDRIYRLERGVFQVVSQNAFLSIEGIEIDPVDSDNMYIFVKNRLYKSTNRGVKFSEFFSTTHDITSIAVSSSDNSKVYLTTSQEVYKSTDGGNSFSDITYNLPDETKMIVKHQGLHPDNPIYVGTSLGVYRLDDTTNIWEPFVVNLPNVPIRDLEINLVDGNITAATYGRGVWRSDLLVRQAAVDLDMINVSLGIGSESSVICGNFSPIVTIKNNGSMPITSFSIDYNIDEKSTVSHSWTGNLGSNETTDVLLANLDAGTLGRHQINFSVSTAGDAFLINNSSSLVFDRNEERTLGIQEFETNTDILLTSGGAWEKGIPTGSKLNIATSGQNVYGTNLDGNYPDKTVGYLISNCYNLSTIENPVLKFNMAFDLENNWDFVTIEYTMDYGASWNILGSADDPNWYNSDRVSGSDCFNCPGAQWTGTDSVMKEYSYNLAAFVNETNFIFRFKFVSDQSVNQEGVIVDDLTIDGNILSTDEFVNKKKLVVHPNPSKNIFNIQWNNVNEVSYDVFDITGKMIYSKKAKDIPDNFSQIDLSNYTEGMYFLKITMDDVEENIKLIRN